MEKNIKRKKKTNPKLQWHPNMGNEKKKTKTKKKKNYFPFF